jgi:ATP-dependent DNA helicase RecG
LVFTEKEDEKTLARLNLLRTSSDGFYLAEQDLKLRGAGNLYGTLQSGHTRLKLLEAANWEIFEAAKEDAKTLKSSSLPENLQTLIAESLDNDQGASLD